MDVAESVSPKDNAPNPSRCCRPFCPLIEHRNERKSRAVELFMARFLLDFLRGQMAGAVYFFSGASQPA